MQIKVKKQPVQDDVSLAMLGMSYCNFLTKTQTRVSSIGSTLEKINADGPSVEQSGHTRTLEVGVDTGSGEVYAKGKDMTTDETLSLIGMFLVQQFYGSLVSSTTDLQSYIESTIKIYQGMNSEAQINW
ncbi:hypothetical protein IV54_GL000739 [Levilactobacillus paucivorans]|uniref:Uncharacterized protein n=2 Tax=Levilactobacillus paucivorans TaxID=616990 RepID=A0A0R2LH83_9LACO|nr:hypothetical protein IV54_GL000739 [Levilactobacillus paucivorans]